MWLGSATKMRTPPVVKSARRSQSCSCTRIGKARGFWTRSKTASKRNVNDLTVGPVLTQTTEQILAHTQSLLKNPGASLLFGGKELENHKIPDKYGAVEPTAVFVPLVEMMKKENFWLLLPGALCSIPSGDHVQRRLVGHRPGGVRARVAPFDGSNCVERCRIPA